MELVWCIPCQYGAHEEHIEVIEACPPGMMGGASCPCQGECRQRQAIRAATVLADLEVLPSVPDFPLSPPQPSGG